MYYVDQKRQSISFYTMHNFLLARPLLIFLFLLFPSPSSSFFIPSSFYTSSFLYIYIYIFFFFFPSTNTSTPHRPQTQLFFQHSFVNSGTIYNHHHISFSRHHYHHHISINCFPPQPPPPPHSYCFHFQYFSSGQVIQKDRQAKGRPKGQKSQLK